jgi:hypothetical protein
MIVSLVMVATNALRVQTPIAPRSALVALPFALVDRSAPRGGAILGVSLMAIPWAIAIALWLLFR